jgi:hypothetical protein
MESTVEEWKKLGISRAEFNFSCGGDSMNETELHFYDENDNTIEVSSSFESTIDDNVYRGVTFYEASDGHYMGESGVVHITLDEEDEFEYVKEAQSEWCEDRSELIPVPITNEEKEFIDEFVISINKSRWDGDFINYKKDFILNDDKEKLIKSLIEKIENFSEKIYGLIEDGEIHDDSIAYTTDTKEDDTISYEVIGGETNLIISVSVEVYVYSNSDD